MKRKESVESVRLKRVLLNDSLNVPNGVIQVMKKDVERILNAYFEIVEDSVAVEVTVEEKGSYDIKISAEGIRAKQVKIL